ncbi:hypothetical protein MCAP1_002530 [Malassezia caprae]|uniref:NADH:flavin oxidoreductase/NADH oxidase N-terminal domain-containing protein n=1 Tax=Malassezia caprae TaxID=1381934 RepID=A0AAF0IW43_9BASI|nr:hypothetical protein MCAP1_002530 [Malassezia caprae]
MTSTVATLDAPLALPCGASLRNRLVKAPLEEMLSTFGGGNPNDDVYRLYRAWADGGWGMIITGNIGVDRRHIGIMFDMVIPDPGQTDAEARALAAYTKYARATKGFAVDDERADHAPADGQRPLAIAQLVHCGRQSMRGSGRPPWVPSVAPSAVRMQVGKEPSWLDWLLFGTPHALTVDEIHGIVQRFVHASVLLERAGFDGVELHGAHGYLLSSFLNPRTNLRTDAYGGDAAGRFRIIREIVEGVRNNVSKSFVVGIKLNSSDFMQGGQTEDDALQNVRWLAEMGTVDFVEVSGGSYEAPAFAQPQSERTQQREGFFTSFAHRARLSLPQGCTMRIIVTGGFRTRTGMSGAITAGHADAIGLGRPSCLEPALPRKMLDASVPDDKAEAVAWKMPVKPYLLPNIALVGIGWTTIWHSAQMHLTARGQPTDPDLSMRRFFSRLHFW